MAGMLAQQPGNDADPRPDETGGGDEIITTTGSEDSQPVRRVLGRPESGTVITPTVGRSPD